MGTESKPTEQPGKPAQPDKKEGALTEDQLKEVSGGGGGFIDIMSWQMGTGLNVGTGSGDAAGKTGSVGEILKKP